MASPFGGLLRGVAAIAREAAAPRATPYTTPRGSASSGTAAGGWDALLAQATATAATLAADYMDRQQSQAEMPPAPRSSLELALSAARFAEVAYEPSENEVKRRLSQMGAELLHFCPQKIEEPTATPRAAAWEAEAASEPYREERAAMSAMFEQQALPQWYLAHDSAGHLYLTFRGSKSQDDVFRDLCAVPVPHGKLRFHGGFLGGIIGNAELQHTLEAYLSGTSEPLYISGHSLGGSLALITLFVEGMLPPSFNGPVTVVAVGSPPVLHGRPAAASGAPPAPGGGDAGTPPPSFHARGLVLPPFAARARCLVVVNSADAVPRCLGSPLPLAGSLLPLEAAAQASANGNSNVAAALLAALPEYVHLPQTEVLLLRPRSESGIAVSVPPDRRKDVFHLHESWSINVARDHMKGAYVEALEAALAKLSAELR